MAIEYWGIRVPDSLAERVDPATTALVVVDLQNDFVHPQGHCGKSVPIDGFRTVLPANARLIEAARAAGIGVYYTAQVQRPDGHYASAVWIADNLRYGPSFEPLHCMEGSWGAEIADEVAPAPGEVVVRKFRRSGFRGTNLAPMLRSRGVTTVVVSGVAATGCVESTTRDALESDFFAVVPSDCVGDATPDLVSAALATFERLVVPGDLTTSETLSGLWSSRRAA